MNQETIESHLIKYLGPVCEREVLKVESSLRKHADKVQLRRWEVVRPHVLAVVVGIGAPRVPGLQHRIYNWLNQ